MKNIMSKKTPKLTNWKRILMLTIKKMMVRVPKNLKRSKSLVFN